MFVSVRSTHGVSLKTKLIGLLPIRGVDPLGWFFEQPLLNGVFTGDSFFPPTFSRRKDEDDGRVFAAAATPSYPCLPF